MDPRQAPITARSAIQPDQSLLQKWLHLAVLSCLTVAQPLLDLLSRQGEFFVIRRLDRLDILALAGFLLLVVPLPGIVVEGLFARAPIRAQRWLHSFLIGCYGMLGTLLIVKRLIVSSSMIGWAAAGAGGLVFAFIYTRLSSVRSFVSLLSIGLLVVPAAFFFSHQISRLLTLRTSTMLEPPSVECDAPIVFWVFDEFSTLVLLDDQGRINPHRYPNLARLAGRSTWYRNAVTVAESTEYAVPSIVTGRLPEMEEKPWLADHPENLFTLFGGSYRIWASETFTTLCPPELNTNTIAAGSSGGKAVALLVDLSVVYLHLVLPPSTALRLPSIGATWEGFLGGGAAVDVPRDKEGRPRFFKIALDALKKDRREEVDRLIEDISSIGPRDLVFAHMLLPHRPWEFLPNRARYPTGQPESPGIVNSRWIDSPKLVQQAYQRYMLQVMYVDTEIGRMIDVLEDRGWFDQTLIVLVADHGVSFSTGEHVRFIAEATAHETVLVPLLIKAPGQTEGRIIDRRVRTIDIIPTMLELLGVEVPWAMDGRSQAGDDGIEPDSTSVFTKSQGWVEIRWDLLQPARRAIGRKIRLFGDGTDALDLYRNGPAKELLGRAPMEVSEIDLLPWSITLEGREIFEDVDPAGATLPVFVRGTLRGAAIPRKSLDLAVAFNGRIVATTSTWGTGSPNQRFDVMIPPSGLQPGANTFEVFKIDRGADSVALRRFRLK